MKKVLIEVQKTKNDVDLMRFRNYPKTRTRLERMLNVFEQKDFCDEKGIIKRFSHETDDEDIRQMLEILYHVGADPEKREEIEIEWRSYDLWLKEIIKRDRTIAKQTKTIGEKDKTIEELQQKLKQAGLL